MICELEYQYELYVYKNNKLLQMSTTSEKEKENVKGYLFGFVHAFLSNSKIDYNKIIFDVNLTTTPSKIKSNIIKLENSIRNREYFQRKIGPFDGYSFLIRTIVE